MITLPPWAVPNGATPGLIDFGGILRPALGGPVQRVNRQGNRYRVALTFPAYEPEQARVLVSRLLRAKLEGLRVEYPLPAAQPLRNAVVAGAGQAGTALSVRGLVAGSVVREGYWLSLVAMSGQRYLHNTAGERSVSADGTVTLALSEMLRAPFPDGAIVELVRPMIEGLIDEEVQWSVDDEGKVAIGVTVEEAA